MKIASPPVVSTVALILLSWNFQVEWRLKKLFENPSTTSGLIDQRSAEGHGIYYFTYEVNGDHYRGKGQTSLATPEKGTPVTVFYLPENPKNSAISTRSTQAWTYALIAEIVAVIFFTVTTTRFLWQLRKPKELSS